jgi:hypothetical protein
MSATSGHNLIHARSYASARQRHLQRILESYGILTRESLRELSGADGWRTPFSVVLHRAVRNGLIRRLSKDLYGPPADAGDSASSPRSVPPR